MHPQHLEHPSADSLSEELAAAYEREHIAYELHDTLSQKLFSINLMVETLARRRDDAPEQWAALLNELNQTTRETQAVLRILMGTMQPASPQPRDLTARLRELVQRCEQAYHTRIHWYSTGKATYMDSIENAVYRVAETALTTAFQQRAADSAYVSLVRKPNCVTLIVKDDGETQLTSKSTDMVLMRARAAAVGGVLRTRALSQGGRLTKLIWRAGT